jgi:hypothetical protein
MKRLLLILLLTFSFQSSTKADEVEEIEIEGISVGNSLLEFYSKKIIEDKKRFLFKNKKFYTFAVRIKSDQYDAIQIQLKNNDPKYLIYAVEGKILYDNKIDECIVKKDEIFNEIFNFFKERNFETRSGKQKMKSDESGKSLDIGSEIYFRTGGKIKVFCSDWSDEMNYIDNLKVSLIGKELRDWFNSGGPYK